tara:strand:- start:92 stop:2818 length:2727 start_codon:yes stop_codon:yes gene_type:complete
MAIGALTKIITKGIVAGADNLFDEAKVAEKIKTTAEKLEADLYLNPEVDVDDVDLEEYVEKYAKYYSNNGGNSRIDPELEDMVLDKDPDYEIAGKIEKMVDADLQGSTYNVYKSQFNSLDEAEDFDPEVDRSLYNYLSARLSKAENNRLLSEAGREKVLTRTIATLKGMPEYKNLRESMPDFDDLSTQMKKLPAQLENREKALEDFLADSVEKRPQYRGVSSLQDTEWDARFWMTNEIGPHVGTLGQANYFGLKALVDDNEFGKHMALFSMGIEGNKFGETFERAGIYIKPEDFNKIYDLTLQVNSYLDDFLRDLELDPNDLKSYTKLSIAETGEIDDFVPKAEEVVQKDVKGKVMFRSRGKQPLTGWEEIVEAVATQYLGMEKGNTTRDNLLLEHEVKAVAKLLGQMRGWGDNVYGSNVRPATIQKGYVNVKNPLKIGNDGVWKIETLFNAGDLLEESIWDNGGIDMFLDAMAVQLNTSRESISKSIPFKKLNEKAQMLSRESKDIEVSSIPQFEQSQALSMEIAGLHQEFRKFVESYGFDSIQYINQVEPSFTTDADNYSYILFKPEQWKAVSARRFDPNDKRFGAAEGGVIGFFSRLMSDQDEVQRPTSRVVQRGDTLEKISRETGVSVNDLQKFNNIEDPNRIAVGQSIRFEPPVEKNQVVSNLASYLNPFASDKTERDYDTRVVGELKKAAKNAISSGRMNIEYEDYRGANVRGQASNPKQRAKDSFIRRAALGQLNPTEEAAFSVGGAQILVEDGKVFATDIYDFSEIPFDKVKDVYSGARYLAGKIPGKEFRSKILLGTTEEFGLREGRAKGGKIDKKKMKCNKPKRTPNHPKKSHVVKACKDGKEKIIRFGEQGAKTAGKPKAGESKRMKAKRKSFKARHRKNIKRGNMSAAYWADKVKW